MVEVVEEMLPYGNLVQVVTVVAATAVAGMAKEDVSDVRDLLGTN